jgi:hypothetical protein
MEGFADEEQPPGEENLKICGGSRHLQLGATIEGGGA